MIECTNVSPPVMLCPALLFRFSFCFVFLFHIATSFKIKHLKNKKRQDGASYVDITCW